VSRYTRQRLLDVLAALDAIDAHLDRGDLSDGLVFDAVRVRLIERPEDPPGAATRREQGSSTSRRFERG
jgi:hypothetical protein